MTDQELLEKAASYAVAAIVTPGDYMCGYYTGMCASFALRMSDLVLMRRCISSISHLLSANHLCGEIVSERALALAKDPYEAGPGDPF